MNEIYSFGYWVKRRRKALDLTQAALAYKVGCATSTIRKIESDERRPSRTMAERLAEGLRISDEEREDFILSGLGEVSVQRMAVPSEPVIKGQQAQDKLPSSVLSAGQERLTTNKNNLPTQPTPFIGRESELTEIRTKLMQDDCQLLTLLGPGGSGKTRLAIETAKGVMAEYQHGVFFVSLAPVQSVEMISSTMAASLGFSFYDEGTPDEQLIDYLRNKQMLLVLDNFEHLLESACLVNEIMNAVRGVKILVTSRASLAITGEHIYPVGGMDYPEVSDSDLSDPQEYSAIRLFEAGARRRQPAFKVTDDNLPDVARICALVEGMPLGIVLAASWVMMLTPAEIADEISRDLEFLKTEMKDLPQRQRSMQSIFNHSWRLLSQAERKILSALSVFRGGFTGDAAREVAGAFLSDLMGLIDQSMLQRVDEGRFEVHELVRQFAADKLAMDPAVEVAVRDRHSEIYCQALAEWESDLEGPQQGPVMKEMAIEIDNIYSAWVWAVNRNMVTSLLGAINGLCHFYERRNQHIEGERACRLVLEMLNDKDGSEQTEMSPLAVEKRSQIEILKLRVRALSWRSHFNLHLVNTDLARKLIETGLNLLEKTKLPSQETRFEKAMTLLRLSSVIDTESRTEAIQFAEDSLKNFKSLDKTWWIGKALEILGELTLSRAERKTYFEESLRIRREQGDLAGIAESLKLLSNELVHKSQFEQAERLAREALSICEQLDDQPLILDTYGLLGSLLVWQGKFSEARALEKDMLVIYNDRGSPHKLTIANALAGFPDQYLGAYEDAMKQAQYSLDLCRKVQHRTSVYGTVFVNDILGRVAVAKGSYPEAKAYFQEIIPLCQTFGWMENEGQVWAGLGFATLKMNQIAQSQSHFLNALGVAVAEQGFLALIHTLPGIALLFANQGQVKRAVELYALVSTFGIVGNSKWFDDIAGDEIARAAEGLPAEVVEAAKARGRSLDMWETAEALLAELEQAGWGSESPGDEGKMM